MHHHRLICAVAALTTVTAPAALAQQQEEPLPVYSLPTEEVSAFERQCNYAKPPKA